MVEFYKGTLETMIERLQRTIAAFDHGWCEKCIPATEEQIQCLEKIFGQYLVKPYHPERMWFSDDTH